MFDIKEKVIKLMGKTEKVEHFACWFTTPFGLFENIDAAAKMCMENDLEPALNVRPVAVAVSETLYEILSS